MQPNSLTPSLIVFFLLVVNTALMAQSKPVQKEKWHWDTPLKQDTTAGYVQVVKVGNILYISGAVATEVTPK